MATEKMRVALALLVSDEFRNRVAHITLRCRDYGFDLRVLRLPAHVSLKQPFMVSDFARFEAYFDRLATRIEPQILRFDSFRFWGNAEHGVVSLHVEKSLRLQELHSRLNRELEEQFGGTQAEFDGADYEFHLTVAIGQCQDDRLPRLMNDMAHWNLEATTEASQLALFIYEESPHPDPLYGVREYGTYRILPLQHATSASARL